MLFCIAVVLICYATSLPNDFIFDDLHIVRFNPQIRQIKPFEFFTSSYWGEQFNAGIYRPLTILSLSVDYALWDVWSPGYRAVNLALHALNGWLVFLLARSILGSVAAAGAAAFIHLAHPAYTEAVVTAVGRGELLSALFFLTAWLLFHRGRVWWCAASFLLALLSKESAITFPAIVLLELWVFGGGWKKVLGAWPRMAVLGATAVFYLAARFAVLGGLGVPLSGQYLGGNLFYWERALTFGRVLIKYFRLVFAPIDLAGDYDFESIPLATVTDWDAWLGLLAFVLLLILAFFIRKNRPLFGFAILFFFVALLPASNLIMPIAILMAERLLYIPMVGVAILMAQFWISIRDARIRLVAGAGVVVTVVILCNSHNYVWQNHFTFYKNMVRVVPDNLKARIGYGAALMLRNRMDEAEHELLEGLRIKPRYPTILSSLAAISMFRQDRQRALELSTEALKIDPNDAASLWFRGDYCMQEGEFEKAEENYRRAVEQSQFPHGALLLSWALALEEAGRKNEALVVFERARRVDADIAVIRQRMGGAGGVR